MKEWFFVPFCTQTVETYIKPENEILSTYLHSDTDIKHKGKLIQAQTKECQFTNITVHNPGQFFRCHPYSQSHFSEYIKFNNAHVKLYSVFMRDDYQHSFEASKFWIPRPKFTSLEIIINLCNDNTLGHRYLWLVDQQPGHMSSFDNKVRFRRRMLRYDLEKAMLVFIDVFEQFKNNVNSYDMLSHEFQLMN